MKHQKMK